MRDLAIDPLDEAIALEEELALVRARRGLLGFTRHTKSDFSTNWHHRRICQAVNALERRDTPRALLASWGITGKELERQLTNPHPVTKLYCGLTNPEAIDKPLTGLQVMIAPRHGKLCAHDTPVPTPQGLRLHGDLRVGDEVFGSDGLPTRVVALGPDAEASLEVTFAHGEKVVVHPDHLWPVVAAGRGDSIEVLSTAEMRRRGCWVGKNAPGARGSKGRFISPLPPAQQYPAADLDMPPYVLGAWLGDGSGHRALITHAPEDTAVVEAIEALGYPRGSRFVHKTTGVIGTSFVPKGTKVGWPGCRFHRQLYALGVFRNKHIPELYQQSSVAQRLELLAGLIDTDGHTCRKTGRVRFCNANARLIEDVARLVRGLGWRAGIASAQPILSSGGIQGKRVTYQVLFNPTVELPCRLERKRNKVIRPQRRVGVVRIEPVAPRPGRCIQVAAADGLYLVGKQPVLTHNSELISRRTPAWWLGRNPDDQIIACSYSADLSSRMNRDVQRIIETEAYEAAFDTVRLNSSNVRTVATGTWLRNSDIFEVVGRRGVYRSAGVGGGITGMGASLALADDVFKNRKQADSPLERQTVWEWYTSTLYTRLQKRAAKIVINTRWHEYDLSGRTIAQAIADPLSDQWLCLVYPALLDCDPGPGDPRRPDEALWPDEFSADRLKQIRATVGSYEFEALYQQRPNPQGGGVVHETWWRYYTRLPDRLTDWTISADLAFKDSEKSDFCAFQVWAADGPADRYLVDQVMARMEFTEQLRTMASLSEKYPQARVKLVEDAANGAALVSTLKRHIPGIIAVKPEGSKQARAEAVSPQIEAGNVYLPSPSLRPWVEDFLTQWRNFPNGAHDDAVDSASMALSRMLKKPSYVGASPLGVGKASRWGL